MARSALPFERFDLRPAFRKAGKPTFLADRPIHGWDTETANGAPFILSYAFQAREPSAIHDGGDPLDAGTVLEVLTHREARGACNVWYNLDFDANVILSALPTENLFELIVYNRTAWKGHEIAYLPGKLLSIRKHKHRYDHFDVAQFFLTSLENASLEWLGVGKEKGELDVTRFDEKKYRAKNFPGILHYAKVDAVRVRDLFRSFVDTAEPLGIPCGRPYSTGYLGEQSMNVIFRGTGKAKPGFGFGQMQAMAWEAYRGGRFEVIERGVIGEAVTVDINSAYPDVLRRLPDPASLQWWRAKRPKLEEIQGADYGIVEAIVSTDERRPMQPFPIKLEGKLQFPTLRSVRVVATKPEIEYAISAGFIRDVEFRTAWLGYAGPHTAHPFTFLEELYEERKALKKQGRDKAQYILKKIINSVYGKLCQLTETIEPCDDGDDPDFFPIDALPNKLREWAEKGAVEIKRQTKCGAYFNPFLASHITALTRLNLIRTAVESGLENDVLMLATDSIMVRAAAFDRSGFQARTSNELGGWELETRGEAFIVGSGIYEIRLPDGSVKARTRGFERGFGAYMMDLTGEGGLRAVAERTEGTTIPITTRRPLKIPQAIYQNFDVADVGKFFDFPRGITAGMDSKRNWPRGAAVTWRELLSGAERSAPKSFDSCGILN